MSDHYDPLVDVNISDYCCCGSKAHPGHPCFLGIQGARAVREFLATEQGDTMPNNDEVYDAAFGSDDPGLIPFYVGITLGLFTGLLFGAILVGLLT